MQDSSDSSVEIQGVAVFDIELDSDALKAIAEDAVVSLDSTYMLGIPTLQARDLAAANKNLILPTSVTTMNKAQVRSLASFQLFSDHCLGLKV